MRLCLVAVVVAQVSISHADEARQAAEQLEKQAKDTRDSATYVACGQAYLDLYNQDPKNTSGDELLYNAGLCFSEGGSIGVAIQMFDLLAKVFPASRLVPQALGRAGKLYELIGSYQKAAETFEKYASKYAGDKDAYAALGDATALRVALGDDAKQIANTLQFVKLFGAKKQSEATHAMFSLTEVYRRKGPADLEKHLRDFLRQYGNSDPELAGHAHFYLGESLWQRACPAKLVDGLCVKIERDRTLPLAPRRVTPTTAAKTCGPAATMKTTAVPRTAKLVEEALRAFTEAERSFGRMPSPSPAATHALAKAKLALADRDVEAYLAVKFPAGLNFSPDRPQQKQASIDRFQDFISNRQKTGGAATARYEAILMMKDAFTGIAATQRLAFISQVLATELMSAPIPNDIRTGEFAIEKIEAYCDKMLEVAEPLLKRAIASYDICLDKSSQLGIDDVTVKVCARERSALGPTTFALSTEMVAELPLALPTFDEPPVRKSRALPPPYADAVEKFSAVYGPKPIPDAQCVSVARAFETFAKQATSADALFMAGLTYGRCNQIAKARASYAAALALDPKHARSISNLGELEYRAGNLDAARKQWEQAIAVDAKLFGAHLGLATLTLRELRGLPANAPTRAKLISTAELHASSAAAVANVGSPLPYVQLAIVAIHQNKLPLARHFASRAAEVSPAPHTELLRAYLATKHRGGALGILEAAAAAPWKLEDNHLALGLHYLALRRYNDAATVLARVKRLDYDVSIARGVAARGMGKLADAEARYNDAFKLDPNRPEAMFDLGVLWKDYTAARATEIPAAKAAFKKAADAFRRAGTPEAKLLADDCDRSIAALAAIAAAPPAAATPAPVTPAPVTPAPVTPAPVTPPPAP